MGWGRSTALAILGWEGGKKRLEPRLDGSRESAATLSQFSAKIKSEDFRSSLDDVPGIFETFVKSMEVKSIKVKTHPR